MCLRNKDDGCVMLNSSPFFASNSAAELIRETLQTGQFLRIATAYFEPSGYQILQDVLRSKRVHLLIGREEGGKDRLQVVLDDFVERFLARPLDRRTEAMRQMLDALERGQLQIAIGEASEVSDGALLDARYLYQHAKLYIADEHAAVVTSANCSHHGLKRSIEAGIRVTNPPDVMHFVERFDYYFQRAESITAELIERLRQLLNLYPPYYVYARALLELYDLPEEDIPPQLPPLSDYQRPYVSRTLEAMRNLRGAMMIASTGLGKTVMAAHTAAYMKAEGLIDRVLVICPAGLRENWRRFMRMARLSSIEFSYSTFSLENDKKYGTLRMLLYELRSIDPKTLVLIDECHHLRNPKHAANRQRQRYRRVRDAIHKQGAYSLLLTATPFSRSIKDVNAQLALLPVSIQAAKDSLLQSPTLWKVQDARDLPDLPPCPTLTTPTVVHQFSRQDSLGHRYVEFTQGGKRYFPHRIHMRSIVHKNSLDHMLSKLLDGHLLNLAVELSVDQLNFGDDWGVSSSASSAGLIKAEIMKQFCSSPEQIEDLVNRLKREGGFKKTRFAHQDELTEFMSLQAEQIRLERKHDEKFNSLLEIVLGTQEKVVVFCYYRHTARYLDKRLSESGVSSATTEAKSADLLDSMLRRFAPIANEVSDEERSDREDVRVLVVTSALAEGYNLQDAAVLVNYDLPWTVLMLAQRMGRVLRPWTEPREITIYNFIPEAMFNPNIQMAMKWHDRLLERSAQHRALADIPVMQTNGSGDEVFEMADLAQVLKHEPDQSLELEDVLALIEKQEPFETSTFFQSLLGITKNDRRAISALLPGYRSALKNSRGNYLFLLMRYRRRVFSALFRQDGSIMLDAEQADRIMGFIDCTPSEPISSSIPEDGHFDRWIDASRTNWCRERRIRDDEVLIICAMAVTS